MHFINSCDQYSLLNKSFIFQLTGGDQLPLLHNHYPVIHKFYL